MSIYKLYVSELKADYTSQVLNTAIRVWKRQGLSNENMSDKIENLQQRLERASKKEFIKIFESYIKREKES